MQEWPRDQEHQSVAASGGGGGGLKFAIIEPGKPAALSMNISAYLSIYKSTRWFHEDETAGPTSSTT